MIKLKPATATAFAFIAIAIAATATSSRAQTANPEDRSQRSEVSTLNSSGTATGYVTTEDPTSYLERYTVTASRTREDLFLIPTSVTSLALFEVQRMQIPDLRATLQLVPGVNIAATGGATGSKTSIFIRGAGTNQTLLLIDGIRMNAEDWTSGYGGYLGAAGLAGIDCVEILRGPQSTLYGSAAMGGVVSIETAHGYGPASGLVALDGGSFNSIGATVAVKGRESITTAFSSRPQTLSYSASLATAYTENDRDFNTFKQLNGSTRLEYKLDTTLTAGLTYRGLKARYEEPGPTYDPTQAGIMDTDVNLATAYAAWTPRGRHFTSRLTYGWLQNIYRWDSAYPSYAHSTRNVLDWQNNYWNPFAPLELVAGLNTEWSLYDSGDAALRDRLVSGYINAIYTPIENLHLTAGARADHYDTLDTTRATWRAGAAYRIEQTRTTLRATIGTGFNAPAPQYILGGGYYAPSPDLKPESSTGWDIGIEQDILPGKITLGATYFHNDFKNKFSATPDAATYLYKYGNIPGATTQGIEAALYARPLARLNIQLAYTYLDARDSNNACLILMPRHSLTADVNYQITKEFLIGAGITQLAGRPAETYYTYDPVTWASVATTEKMASYAVFRAYASYALLRGIKLKLRVENLLDKKYATTAGYPGLPLGVFGGVEWKF